VALEDVARAQYAVQAATATRAQEAAAALWAELAETALLASWIRNRVGDRMLVTVSAAQAAATAAADPYVGAAAMTQGASPTPEGTVAPAAFAGIASDGRGLDTLLLQPVLTALGLIARGAAPVEAKRVGGSALSTIVGTQVVDAGRAATSVATVTRPQLSGWVRMLTPPSCGRCAILAGRFYRWSSAFDRHPHCDCIMISSVEDAPGDLRTDPMAYFRSLPTAAELDAQHPDLTVRMRREAGLLSQEDAFTATGAQAIRDGADIRQVVNARRGANGLSAPGRLTADEQKILKGGRAKAYLQRVDVYGRQVYVTHEGTTRRGVGGKKLGAWSDDAVKHPGSDYRRAKIPRLMPEGIYELAGNDRDEAIRLLKRFGYIT
jgi:hypothetical protein